MLQGTFLGLFSPARGALLFDLDGVLIDSTRVHAEAFRETLGGVGLDGFVYGPYAGMRTPEVIRAELRRGGVPESDGLVERLAMEKSALAAGRLESSNPVFPHALNVLERLSAAFPIALVSSGSESSVWRFVESNDLRGLFGAVVHGGDVTNAKPAPDPYIEAARRLGVEPADCLVLEDADSGEASARAAGCAVWRIDRDFSIAGLPERLGLNRCARIVSWQDAVPAERIEPGRWSAIIPAAGRGTRLGSSLPKILFEVAGRSILDWLLDLLLPRCGRVVIVAAPSTAEEIGQAAARRSPSVSIAVQPEPVGMADAIERGLARVETDNVLTIWGDQAAVREESIDFSMRVHRHACALATVPTLWRHDPYIHFERDGEDAITAVRQAREGDAMPAEGESDSGIFLFRTRTLRRQLRSMSVDGAGVGRRTGERNLLPLIARLDSLRGNVISARIMSDEESVGANTPGDARFLTDVLSARIRSGA
jgi:bifunctional UDP-N-acetylglucosamine pyrophosphorylase / glucosamine-1-phosphate N-acetyltransferase